VTVSPSNPSTVFQGQVNFTATVAGTTDSAVTWSVKVPGAPAAGSVDASGSYHAPSTAGTFEVVATSVADPTQSAVARVSVARPFSTPLDNLLKVDRTTVWQPGVTYNGGIPVRTSVYATLTPSGGDDTAAVQNAVSAAGASATNEATAKVVKLGAGTFNINGNAINLPSFVTLRGSGPGVTILNSTSKASVVIAGTLYFRYIDQRSFTADATKDAYSVSVSSASGLRVGEIVSVTELYDPTYTKYDNDAQTSGGDYLGGGECAVAHSDGGGYTDRGTGCPVVSPWSAQGAMNQSRPLGQMMEIATIGGNSCTGAANANCLTFSTPFHMTWRVNHGARLSRIGWNDLKTLQTQVTRAGVEDLTVQNAAGGDDAGPVAFLGASYCWAKHIELVGSEAVGILFKSSFRGELRDSYIHETANANPGGAGYGIGIDSYSSDCLVENNISWNFNKVMVMRDSGGGNVIAYNYMQDGWGAGYPNLAEVGLNASHMTTSHHELFEGNEAHNFSSDTTWGNTIYVTVLRNHLTGLRIAHAPGGAAATPVADWDTANAGPWTYNSLVDQGNRRAVDVNDGDRWFSFVGNVLGCSTTKTCANAGDALCKCAQLNPTMLGGPTGQTSWQYDPTSDNDSYAFMWKLMYMSDTDPVNGDKVTLLRQGNYDFATNAQHWIGLGWTGTPDSGPPADATIANSAYLTTKPPFFGSNPWPWVDPSSGTTYVLPARARFDAGTPNTVP